MHYMGPSESDKSEIPARRQRFWGNEGWARLQSSKRDTTKKKRTHIIGFARNILGLKLIGIATMSLVLTGSGVFVYDL